MSADDAIRWRVMAAITREWRRPRDVADELDLPRDSVYRVLRDMKALGYVESRGKTHQAEVRRDRTKPTPALRGRGCSPASKAALMRNRTPRQPPAILPLHEALLQC